MLDNTTWLLIALQIVLGAFDTMFHHEGTERLAWRPSQWLELRLHALRSGIYGIVFIIFGWTLLYGIWAILFAAVLVFEIGITLWDFVEEDKTRALPASERVLHTLLALNYGAILAALIPTLIDTAQHPNTVTFSVHMPWTIFATLSGIATFISALRDAVASFKLSKQSKSPKRFIPTMMETRQSFLITGATGFIGEHLVQSLIADGHDVTVLTRRPDIAAKIGSPLRIVTDLNQISSHERIHHIINLAGEPIAKGRWTKKRRDKIIHSRVGTTRALITLVQRMRHKPTTLINGSAVGWYGCDDHNILDETTHPKTSFSHTICSAWEHAAFKAEELGIRVVCLRIGLVLGAEGGFLSRLLAPFEFGLGGPIGDGQQWMSWISREDLIRLIFYSISNPEIKRALNATAPNPVRNLDFTKALGKALNRPVLLRLPARPLRIFLGEMADELMLSGQRAIPKKATAEGFQFLHNTIQEALRDIFKRPTTLDQMVE